MLTEFFHSVGNDLIASLRSRGINVEEAQIRIGPATEISKPDTIAFQLLRFGSDAGAKNVRLGSPVDKSYYAFSFVVAIATGQYSKKLEWIERISDHLHKKPFWQLSIEGKEFEVALSPLELTITDINQFWIAQAQPWQPVLFYQARVSEV